MKAKKTLTAAQQKLADMREACRASLWEFAKVVEPHRVYGQCHKDLFDFWQQSECMDFSNTLALLPRDHQKSHCLAVRCAWEIFKDPAITIVYVSATSELAERQLLDIGNIMESRYYRSLSPKMIHKDKGKRAMWNTKGISVDHPLRKKENPRDPTIATAGMTTNTTGWHCSFLAKDDVVVPQNAYTSDARSKVEAGCSQLASVLTTGGSECAVGTRYHPKDHYSTLQKMMVQEHDEEGNVVGEHKVYEIHQRQVEESGVFLWPRMARKSDGKMFGFNWVELAIKKAKYKDRLQFFAQYYNNPNDMEGRELDADSFQYYKREDIVMKANTWYYKDRRLNVYASMDFAYSLNMDADWTCIVVFGVDWELNYYVLDIDRFKTKKIAKYFSHLETMIIKWEFKKLRAEVTAAQAVIVQSLKDLIKTSKIHCKVFDFRPMSGDGSKEERMEAALMPIYDSKDVFHYQGGNCALLEEELLLDNPPHDDIKDSFASGVSAPFIRKPRRPQSECIDESSSKGHRQHSRFGGYSTR